MGRQILFKLCNKGERLKYKTELNSEFSKDSRGFIVKDNRESQWIEITKRNLIIKGKGIFAKMV